MLRRFFLATVLFFFSMQNAHAYIDPGSGGYLITTLLAWIGGALAFSAAFLIHFFKFTFKKFVIKLWSQHRLITILLLFFMVSGICLGGYYQLKPSPKNQGGLVAASAQ